MAINDPQWPWPKTIGASMPCGCHTGPWWGVQPPPRCAQHSVDYITTVQPDTLPIIPGTRPWTPIVRDPDDIAAEQEAIRQLVRASKPREIVATKFPSDKALKHLVKEIGGQIGTQIGNAAVKGEQGTAEHDAWQLALQAHVHLQQCIERALAAREQPGDVDVEPAP